MYYNLSMLVFLVLISTGIVRLLKLRRSRGARNLQRTNFYIQLLQFAKKTFRPHTIKLGFRLTGLWPIDPKLITNELVEVRSLPSASDTAN